MKIDVLQLLARFWFWRMLVSIQILIQQVLKNCFWHWFLANAFFLVLVNAFFPSNSNLKIIEFLIFPALGKILALVNAVFHEILIKSIEKLIFQLLAW